MVSPVEWWLALQWLLDIDRISCDSKGHSQTGNGGGITYGHGMDLGDVFSSFYWDNQRDSTGLSSGDAE